MTSGKVGVDVDLIAEQHRAVDADDRLLRQARQALDGVRAGSDHKLGQPIMVAQVDEEDPSQVPPIVDPPGQPYGLTGLGGPELATCVCPITMHESTKSVMSVNSQKFIGTGKVTAVSYTHLRAHETRHDLVCRL